MGGGGRREEEWENRPRIRCRPALPSSFTLARCDRVEDALKGGALAYNNFTSRARHGHQQQNDHPHEGVVGHKYNAPRFQQLVQIRAGVGDESTREDKMRLPIPRGIIRFRRGIRLRWRLRSFLSFPIPRYPAEGIPMGCLYVLKATRVIHTLHIRVFIYYFHFIHLFLSHLFARLITPPRDE